LTAAGVGRHPLCASAYAWITSAFGYAPVAAEDMSALRDGSVPRAIA